MSPICSSVDAFFENAREIFDVARMDTSGESDSFALVVRPDGGLHFIMDGPVSLQGAAAYTASQSAFVVTRSASGIRVEGQSAQRTCVFEERRTPRLASAASMPYWMTSPVRISSSEPEPSEFVAAGFVTAGSGAAESLAIRFA